MHSVSTKLTTTCGKKIEKNYLSYYQKSNQGRDILYQSHIEHYATAPDTKTLSSNASTALSPNKSKPGKFLLTCNINTERKDLNDFSSGSMKGNSITCLCISFVYCEDASQSNSYVSYWIRCKPLLIIKVSFIFPFEPRMYV